MSLCSQATNVTPYTAAFPQVGQGVYLGKMPGSSNNPPYINLSGGIGAGYSGADYFTSQGVTLQTDTGYISSIVDQPQNVLRLATGGGVGFIQGTDIAFSVPYSGTAGIRILPSTNQINVNKLMFVSSLQVEAAGNINMTQLVSSIAGYGWANIS